MTIAKLWLRSIFRRPLLDDNGDPVRMPRPWNRIISGYPWTYSARLPRPKLPDLEQQTLVIRTQIELVKTLNLDTEEARALCYDLLEGCRHQLQTQNKHDLDRRAHLAAHLNANVVNLDTGHQKRLRHTQDAKASAATALIREAAATRETLPSTTPIASK